MGKITASSSPFFNNSLLLLFIFLCVTSCSSISMVAIKNNTDETILFHGDFEYKQNAPYYMDFTLKPGENNLWEYELGSFEENIIDKGLKKVTLKNEQGCTIVLEREAIEKLAIKHGPWTININKDLINCK